MELNSGSYLKAQTDVIKVNVDAALYESEGCFGFAYVARNDKGELIEANSSCREGSVTPEIAEAVGIREA